jgi:DNA-binding NarL/FixJ family response regulator
MASAPSPVTVAIGVFEDLVGLGLRELMGGDESLRIVANEVPPDRFAAVLEEHHPDVLVLDWDGLPRPALLDDLRRRYPGTRLLVLTGPGRISPCPEALARGVAGCLGKDAQGRDIINAIHLASRGLRLLPDAVAGGRRRPEPADGIPLTPREVEVLRALEEGCTNAQIADRLAIGLETVRTHSRNIYRKLGVRSRRELAGVSRGNLQPPDDGGAAP